jgi:ATP-dependent DNA ligase
MTRELQRRVRAEEPLPLPKSAKEPPSSPGWIHEIKHDRFRILAHRRGRSLRLFSRNGHNFADRFPLATAAIEALPVRSCVIDGEAIVCDEDRLAVFDLLRGHASNARAVLCAFDLLEVNGEDVRREPIEERKRRLAGLLRLPSGGIALNEQFGGDGTSTSEPTSWRRLDARRAPGVEPLLIAVARNAASGLTVPAPIPAAG